MEHSNNTATMENKILTTSVSPLDNEEEGPISPGYCKEVNHQKSNLRNKQITVFLETDDFQNLTKFEEILKTSPNLVSIQIGGKLSEQASPKFSWDTYGQIMQLVTKYCANRLECFSLFFSRTLEVTVPEGKIKRKLDSEKKEYNPHFEIWHEFVTAVAPTLRHIHLLETNFPYIMPRFAFERLIAEGPNIEEIRNGNEFPKSAYHYVSRTELPLFGQQLTRKKDPVTCVVSVQIGFVDLGDNSILNLLMQFFPQLRQLHLYYAQMSMTNDCHEEEWNFEEGFDKLLSLSITPHELGVISDTWKGLDRNEIPLNLILPKKCKIKRLEIKGLIMKDSFWVGLKESVPMLTDLIYCVAHHPMNSIDLTAFADMKFLQCATLDVPCKYWADDIIKLLQSKHDWFRLRLYNGHEMDHTLAMEWIIALSRDEKWTTEIQDTVGLEVQFLNHELEVDDGDSTTEQNDDEEAQEEKVKIDNFPIQETPNFKMEWRKKLVYEKDAKWVLNVLYKCTG